VKEMRLDAYAERFAAAGHHVLVFDYRHFGASTGEPRQLLDIARQHADWVAAVEYVRSRPEVDPDRIALWGSSLSGGHVIAVADRVRPAAVIAQVPDLDGPASALAMKPTRALRLTAHGLVDVVGKLLGRSPHYIPASGAPGALAVMTTPEAARYLRLVPTGQDFDQRLAARFTLHATRYSPARKLRHLDVPVLMQLGSRDETTPPRRNKFARRSPTTTVRVHDTGHFDPYVGEQFEVFVAEQLAFLDRTVGAPTHQGRTIHHRCGRRDRARDGAALRGPGVERLCHRRQHGRPRCAQAGAGRAAHLRRDGRDRHRGRRARLRGVRHSSPRRVRRPVQTTRASRSSTTSRPSRSATTSSSSRSTFKA
jgi:uncharacterized protein